VPGEDDFPHGLLAEKLAALADSLAGQQAGMLFTKINEVAQVEGNTIDAAGQPFSKELFLAALSKIEINFDEATGEPTGPGLVIPEQRAAEFFKEIASWESDTAFQAAFDAIMAGKKEEWRARESSRRLAD